MALYPARSDVKTARLSTSGAGIAISVLFDESVDSSYLKYCVKSPSGVYQALMDVVSRLGVHPSDVSLDTATLKPKTTKHFGPELSAQ